MQADVCEWKLFFRQKNSLHSSDFENEPLFAPISQNELTADSPLKEAEKGVGEGGIEISGENMAERGKEIEAIIARNYVESVMKIQLAELIPPQDVANPAGDCSYFYNYCEFLWKTIHGKKDFCGGDGYFGQKKMAEKVP